MRRRDRLVAAAVVTLIATLCGFLVMGTSRGFVGYRTARLLSVPFIVLAAASAVYAFSVSVLVYAGVLELG
ncbi:hypothetical protein [Salarchaeum japonicum]|uniref:hypothetical protein n=1 Tax=Salarchaeum japonicum TaxID=555573 RepID=UPI003C78B06F